MNKLKNEASELRKQEKSYNEINKLLGVPKSTLSNWFKTDKNSLIVKNKLIKKAQIKSTDKLKLMAAANKKKWQEIHLSYRKQAIFDFPSLIKEQYFLPGLLIYWGEGDKKLENGIVRIANIDYRMIKIFILFIIHSCNIKAEKIRLWLLLYPDLNEGECKNYWSKSLGIPQNQFIKSQYISGREKKKKINYGVCSVQVYSREIKEKIIEWINVYSQRLLENAGIV